MLTQIPLVTMAVVGFLLLVAAVALDVSSSRLAQAATVRALRDWAAFFIDMDQRAVYRRS